MADIIIQRTFISSYLTLLSMRDCGVYPERRE